MNAEPWQFWIDVGGTFTDCLARRGGGEFLRHKVLSSGRTKGRIATGSTASQIVDPSRRGDPNGFWLGYRCQLLDGQGRVTAETTVAGFDGQAGLLTVSPPFPAAPSVHLSYELMSPEPAPIFAVRWMLGLQLSDSLPKISMRLGTTRGTNALITRSGARTALVTTRGLGDVLRIGYQNRPHLFDLEIRKPAPLERTVIEVDERMTPEGLVLQPLDAETLRPPLQRLRDDGIESLAICLLNGYAHPQHEALVSRVARDIGFKEISVSSQVAPLVKIVPRGDTTVVDAYLNPVLRTYMAKLRQALGSSSDPCELRILTSAGGLVGADHFVGKDSILSGPAGGVVGFSRVAKAAGFDRAIGFDMGGTSTDVSRFDGRFELQYETEKAGVRVVAPMMAIETVAAGGGSICHFDGVQLRVGPDSAGADPGPVCYGRGGPLAITDANFYLGKLVPDYFPFPLDGAAVDHRLRAVCHEIETATGQTYTPHELADGFVRLANSNMVKAIRTISVAKGCDPRDYVLVCFGGAAPQHACSVARELGIRTILNHPDAGILSAYGMGLADVVRHRVAGVYQNYTEHAVRELQPVLERLAQGARQEIVDEGVPARQIAIRYALDLRYHGVDAYLTVPEPRHGSYAQSFVRQHQKRYGYVHEGRTLEIVAARVEAVGRTADDLPKAERVSPQRASPERETTAYFDAQPRKTLVYRRDRLRPGDTIEGPAILVERVSTTVVDPNWTAEVLSDGQLLVTDRGVAETPAASAEADPVTLEIFNNHFAGIADQMGVTLRNTSSSVNVKERLDFSCAIFTASGELVVNAPHIPVHLGAMGQTVRRVIADHAQIEPGDAFITNDPYRGGSHLPDVTIITPVHDETSGELLFFTASRAHHAEIGGIVPGSMPPFSQNLAEEGVLIRSMKVVEAGKSRLDRLRQLLLGARYPTRSVDDNLADVAAQIAANQRGAVDLKQLARRYGSSVVAAHMKHIQDAAARKMRAALARLPDGTRRWTDHLDDGSPVTVAMTIHGEQATIDFTGTGPVLPGNLNANKAIVTAAVMYCLRCLIGEDIPMNEGMLAPVNVIIPESLLNPPEHDSPAECAAMVGGNVETSQRVVDVLLGALGMAAASQGTMNNVMFGDDSFGYYETICGGAGATANRDGADAVHTHMTNTRMTDPEVLERRYHVRVREFSIRRGSGGAGRHRGGDGVIRRLEFTRPLKVSILSQRRGAYAPYGLDGGMPGAIGRNSLRRADGRVEPLASQAQFDVGPGDVLTIETPGGGGFGRLPEKT